MQDFRNLLRQRLGAIPEPQAHPDADTLSAYAEQVLTPAERNKIQEHLAACSPCREVVAFSLPQLQNEDQQVVLRPAGRSWALGLRWAALAAMIIVIIGLAVQQPWREKSETRNFATVTNAPAKSADTAQPTTTAPTSTTAAQPAAPSPATPVIAAADTPAKDRTDLAPSRLQRAPRQANNPAAPQLNLRSPQPAADAKAFPTIFARGPAAAGPANMANNSLAVNNTANRVTLDSSNNSGLSAPTPKTQVPLTAEKAFTRTAPPISTTTIGSVAAGVTTDQANKSLASAPAPLPSNPGKIHQALTFVLKAPGKVASVAEKAESSTSNTGANAFAPGRGVRFDPHSALNDHANTRIDAMEIRSSPLHWSISPDGKLIKSETRDQWHEAYPQDQDLQFRTVWTDPNGHEVWAGGSHLTIIHSWNGGVNWQKMQLDPATDSGDITNISIDDGSVLVKTSNGQTFVSHDKGATWVPLKQNQPAQQPK